jgi:Tol biopolymer transport system component
MPNDSAGGSINRGSISSDGRYIAFTSGRDNLATNDTNNTQDVFLLDRQTGTTTLVSTTGTASGNNRSFNPVVSADGRYVAFDSNASNLVANDSNGTLQDVFVRDLVTGTTTLVSTTGTSSGNNQSTSSGNNQSSSPVVSADGRYVAFISQASNLVANDSNGTQDVFVRDLVTGTTTLVSTTGTTSGNIRSVSPVVSADGRYVAFTSLASNLVANDSNNTEDVFVRDLVTGTTTLVSTTGTASGNRSSDNPVVSADGRYVAFTSYASNLATGDYNGTQDVFGFALNAPATLLWRNGTTGTAPTGTGENAVWQLNNFTRQNAYYIPTVADLNWQMISTADFNRDGNADILWRNRATGENAVWLMNSTGFQPSYYLPPVADANWRIIDTGDFTGDGTADLVWRHQTTGENAIWQMSSTGFRTSYYLNPVADANWQIVSTADFNADGVTDLLWRNQATGENSIWLLDSTGLQTSYYINPVADANWQVVGTADLNNDGLADLVWRNRATGENALWQMNRTGLQTSYYLNPVADANWQVVGVADLGGNSTPDLLWRNTATGQTDIWQLSGFSFLQSYQLPTAPSEWSVRPFALA